MKINFSKYVIFTIKLLTKKAKKIDIFSQSKQLRTQHTHNKYLHNDTTMQLYTMIQSSLSSLLYMYSAYLVFICVNLYIQLFMSMTMIILQGG